MPCDNAALARCRTPILNKIRIVGGTHRSRLIPVPEATGLRPTPDRVRETLFNWLGQDLQGLRCLDLFSGSGGLGFEAASRGAASVVMVEMAPKVVSHLRETISQLQFSNVRLISGDALKFLRASQERFDVVFLDPPFRQDWLARIEPLVLPLLTPAARVYIEAEEPVEHFGSLRRVRSGKAGQVHYQLLCEPVPPDTHE